MKKAKILIMAIVIALLVSCSEESIGNLGRGLQKIGTVNLGYGGSVALENLESSVDSALVGVDVDSDENMDSKKLANIVSLLIAADESSIDSSRIRDMLHDKSGSLKSKIPGEGTHFVEILNNATATVEMLKNEFAKVDGYDASHPLDESVLEDLLKIMGKFEATFEAIDQITAQQNERDYVSKGDYIAKELVYDILNTGIDTIITNPDEALSKISDNILNNMKALQIIYNVDFNLSGLLSGLASGS